MIKEVIKKQIRKTGTYRVLEIENQKLKSQNQTLQNEKTILQKDKENITHLNQTLQNEKTILQKDKENITHLNQTLQNEKTILQKDKENITHLNQTLQNEKTILQKDKENITHLNQTLQNEKRDYGRLINNLKIENDSLKIVFIGNDYRKQCDWDKFTIIIPYRKTNDPDRKENLDINLKYLNSIRVPNIIISEHSDVSTKEFLINNYANLFKDFKVVWNNANGKLFNKSLAINEGVIKSKTPYIAIFDMDCLTKKENINMAINLLDRGFEIVYPFNRRVTDIVDKEKFKNGYDFHSVNSPVQNRPWADGGIVFWNKDSFINIGMKNEYFTGWGGEDNEILIRATLYQLRQIRIDDVLYHLYHHRLQIRSENNIKQMRKIEKMKSKEEFLNEINKWPWVEKAKKTYNE